MLDRAYRVERLMGFIGLIGFMGSRGFLGLIGFKGLIGFLGLRGFINVTGFRGVIEFIGFSVHRGQNLPNPPQPSSAVLNCRQGFAKSGGPGP